MEKYLIHNDLSNQNRKRIDILDNTITLSDIKELSNYNVTIEESFKDGNTQKYYIILTELDNHDIKLNSLLKALNDNNIDISSVDGYDTHHEVTIKSFDYDIHIDVINEEFDGFDGVNGFDLGTVNTNINWNNKADEDIYFDSSDMFKNQCNRKNIKSVISYIEKYI